MRQPELKRYTGYVYFAIDAENQEDAEQKISRATQMIVEGVRTTEYGVQYEGPSSEFSPI